MRFKAIASIVLCVLTLSLAACTRTTTPVPTQPLTVTPAAPDPTNTPAATATWTPQPSPTPVPPSPTPSPTPWAPWAGGLQTISKTNAAGLKEVARLTSTEFGAGFLNVGWPAGRAPLMAVYQYDSAEQTPIMDSWAVYDLGTLKQTIHVTATHSRLRRFVFGLAMSPDGQFVATSGRSNLIKLFSSDGKFVRAFQGHTDNRNLVKFSQDGKTLISMGLGDKTIRLWDISSGEAQHKFPCPEDLVQIPFLSPDGKWLAVSGQAKAYILEVATGKLVQSLPQITLMAFSPDGQRLAALAADRSTIEILDIHTWQPTVRLEGHHPIEKRAEEYPVVSGAVFSPDGTLLVSTGYDDKTLRVWDAATGQQLVSLPKKTASLDVAFPDGKVVMTFETDVDVDNRPVGSANYGCYIWGVK